MRPLDGALALASLLCAGGTSHRTAPPSVVFLHVPKTGGASALEYLLPCRDRIRVLYGAHEQTLSLMGSHLANLETLTGRTDTAALASLVGVRYMTLTCRYMTAACRYMSVTCRYMTVT